MFTLILQVLHFHLCKHFKSYFVTVSDFFSIFFFLMKDNNLNLMVNRSLFMKVNMICPIDLSVSLYRALRFSGLHDETESQTENKISSVLHRNFPS